MDRKPTLHESTNILLEEMRGQFRAVTEHVIQVRDDVGELKQDLAKTNKTVDSIDLRLRALTHEVKDFKNEMSNFKKDVNMTHDAMGHILSDHQHRIKTLETV